MLVWQGESSTGQILFLWMFFPSSDFFIFRMGVCVCVSLALMVKGEKEIQCKFVQNTKTTKLQVHMYKYKMNLWSLVGHYLQSQNIIINPLQPCPLLKQAGAIPKPYTLRLLPGYANRLPNDLRPHHLQC